MRLDNSSIDAQPTARSWHKQSLPRRPTTLDEARLKPTNRPIAPRVRVVSPRIGHWHRRCLPKSLLGSGAAMALLLTQFVCACELFLDRTQLPRQPSQSDRRGQCERAQSGQRDTIAHRRPHAEHVDCSSESFVTATHITVYYSTSAGGPSGFLMVDVRDRLRVRSGCAAHLLSLASLR